MTDPQQTSPPEITAPPENTPRRPIVTPEMMENLPFPLAEETNLSTETPPSDPTSTDPPYTAEEQAIVDAPPYRPQGAQAHAVMFLVWVRDLYRFPADALKEIDNYNYVMGIDGGGPKRTVDIMLNNPRFFGELRNRALNVLAERIDQS